MGASSPMGVASLVAPASPSLRVLVVEDNADMAATVGDFLASHGHHVDYAADGEQGLRLAAAQPFDAIVLDRSLPKLDGAQVCSQLRTRYQSSVPILMLTALDATMDRIHGLAVGADDYLVKPCQMAELEARLLALHRRATGRITERRLRVADLEFDPESLEARRAGQVLALNPTLRKLLEHLMRFSARIVPREELEFLLWGDRRPDSDVLRAHLHKLRDAIDRGHEKKLLHTYRGTGYRLADLG